MTGAAPTVVAVSLSDSHTFSKTNCPSITLVPGLGVDGDAHAGATVQHLSRIAKDPTKPNLRQVHLIHSELFDELRSAGFDISPGQMGENITTRGIDLLGLPVGAVLKLGPRAAVKVTGLRNPCHQIDGLGKGCMRACLGRDAEGRLVRKAGIMSVVVEGGELRPGDGVEVEMPPQPHVALAVV